MFTRLRWKSGWTLLLLTAVIAVVATGWLLGCSDKSIGEALALAGHEGKWMKENLNVETADSWCYENSLDSCAKYGRLYTWEAAKAACQSVGMRLPTRAEWAALVTAAGGSSTAGSKLKSTSGWNSCSGISSTDQYGFSALPGGSRSSDGGFDDAGGDGGWWAATETSGGYAYYRNMHYGYDGVGEVSSDKSYGFSARCVQ